MPTLLAACSFKCTQCLLVKEKQECRYILLALGSATESTRLLLGIEKDTVRWDAFIMDMFKAEQTSLRLVISKGGLWYLGPRHLYSRCHNDSRLLLSFSLFFSPLLSSIFDFTPASSLYTYIQLEVCAYLTLSISYGIYCIYNASACVATLFFSVTCR